MVSIIDYGAGNIRSVFNAFEYLGEKVQVASSAQDISEAERIVFPGVGSSREAMEMLKGKGMLQAMLEAIGEGVLFLGICLGMQLLFERSEENGGTECLGVLPGEVKRFPSNAGIKIPQIGWNTVHLEGRSPLFDGLKDDTYFYFVHSFFCPLPAGGAASGTTEYGIRYSSALERGNVFAVQFHPERSQENGLKVLSNFLKI